MGLVQAAGSALRRAGQLPRAFQSVVVIRRSLQPSSSWLVRSRVHGPRTLDVLVCGRAGFVGLTRDGSGQDRSASTRSRTKRGYPVTAEDVLSGGCGLDSSTPGPLVTATTARSPGRIVRKLPPIPLAE